MVEIVGILLARIYLQRRYRVVIEKIIICVSSSFSLSYLVFLSHNEESNVHLKIAVNRGRSPPSSPSPPGRGGGNQSWLTVPLSVWITDQKGHCHRRGTRYRYQVVPGGIRLVPGWYQTGTRMVSDGTWYRFILDI